MEVRKSILIIKAATRSSVSTETFLRNRDWVLHSTTDIKEALNYLVQNKPSFVLIAVDHPIKKVRTLPKILAQSFPVCVIAFTEGTTTQAYKLLMDSGCDYKINPPMTGPSVERTINKFLKDRDNQSRQPQGGELPSDGKNSGDSQSYTVKGKQPKKKSNENDPGAIIGGQENDENLDVNSFLANSLAAQNSGVIVQKGVAQNVHSFMQEGSGMGEALSASTTDPDSAQGIGGFLSGDPRGQVMQATQEGIDAPLMTMEQETENNEESSPAAIENFERRKNRSGSGHYNPQEGESLDPEIHGTKKKKKASSLGHVPTYHEEDIDDGEGQDKSEGAPLSFDNNKKKNDPKMEGRLGNDSNFGKGSKNTHDTLNQEVHRVGGKHKGWDKRETIMGRATEKALEDSVVNKDEEIVTQVSDSSNVACIIVESERFSGYLVAAMGKNRKIDHKFVQSIKDRLFKFLKDSGEESKEEQNMEIKIKQVDFEDWALEYADFLRRSVQNGEEVAMAFFPFADAKTTMGDSASAEMGAVKLDDLHGDLQVEFNLYIYLPANNRYVLYTPKGSKFYGNQKNRLATMGVTHLHMRKSEAQDLSKYRAQNYLNSKIEEYERKKALKRAV
jgi:DNA-binding response OmpR family regulator